MLSSGYSSATKSLARFERTLDKCTFLLESYAPINVKLLGGGEGEGDGEGEGEGEGEGHREGI